jgi:serine/threonine protein kinase
MHSAKVIHRDLKPENILINAECQVKICDFGLSRGICQEERVRIESEDDWCGELTTYVQTRYYRAPEVILNSDRISHEADCWSIGCIFAELLSPKREILFPGLNTLDQLRSIVSKMGTPRDIVTGSPEGVAYFKTLPVLEPIRLATYFPSADSLAVDLLGELLQFDVKKRINAITKCK